MNPRFTMPLLRQLPRDSERPLWRRLLWFREPVVYELAEPYGITVRCPDGLWHRLILPAGFRSDLASTPRITWLLGFRPDGLLAVPGLYHDWYYRHGSVETQVAVEYERGRWTAPVGDGTRLWGDRLFRCLVRWIGGLWFPAWAGYLALRLFGWFAWRHNARYRAAAAKGKMQLKGDYDD